ncbi:hypothetical protein Tco_0581877 [Tanacetum coccineum]
MKSRDLQYKIWMIETFYSAWDRFNDLLRGCTASLCFPEALNSNTFYNALKIEYASRFIELAAGVSPDVAELKDMVRTLILDKKNQTPAPVKAVEQSCVTCGGGHSYQNCPATDGNIYRDNIQEYVSQAAAANFNQGNTGYRPRLVCCPNQIRPPGFPPVQNHQGNKSKQFQSGEIISIKTDREQLQPKPKFIVQGESTPAYQATVPSCCRVYLDVCQRMILRSTSKPMMQS